VRMILEGLLGDEGRYTAPFVRLAILNSGELAPALVRGWRVSPSRNWRTLSTPVGDRLITTETDMQPLELQAHKRSVYRVRLDCG